MNPYAPNSRKKQDWMPSVVSHNKLKKQDPRAWEKRVIDAMDLKTGPL